MSAFVHLPTSAENAKSRLGSMRSGSPKKAVQIVPNTKPNCTAPVSSDARVLFIKPDSIRPGTTADAENHSVIHATWQITISAIDRALVLTCFCQVMQKKVYSPLQPVLARSTLTVSHGNASITFQPTVAPPIAFFKGTDSDMNVPTVP